MIIINWIIVHRLLEKYSKIWIIIITGRLKTLSKTWYCQLFWMRNLWTWGAKMTTTFWNDILLIIFTEKQNGYRGLKNISSFTKQDSADYFHFKAKRPQGSTAAPVLLIFSSWGKLMPVSLQHVVDRDDDDHDHGGITTQQISDEMFVKKWYCWTNLRFSQSHPLKMCVDRALRSCIILILISSLPPNPALSQIREVETRNCASLCNKQGDLYLVTCHLTLRHVGLCGY